MTNTEAELKNQQCLLFEFLGRNHLEDKYIGFLEELVQDEMDGDTTINVMFGDVSEKLQETKDIIRGEYA